LLWRGDQRRVFDSVEELSAEVVHAGSELSDAGGELVVADKCRHGDDQAGGSGDESFRDARGDGTQGSGACRPEAVEGVDDAHDGPEEADKGSGLRNGGEPRHARFHMREGLAGGGLRSALEGLGVGWSAASAGLALVLVVDFVENGNQRAGAELVGYGSDFREAAGLAECPHELLALGLSGPEGPPLGEHDGPGKDAGKKEDAEHGKRGGAAVVQHLHERPGVDGRGGRGNVRVLKQECCEGKKSHAESSLLRWR